MVGGGAGGAYSAAGAHRQLLRSDYVSMATTINRSSQDSRNETESRRDQEEGGELDSHEEVRCSSFAGPGEIKRREVPLDPL